MSAAPAVTRPLGELEAAVMDVLWGSSEPLTVRQVQERLTPRRLAYTTVMTVLCNLHRKGWLRRTPRGRAYCYVPVESCAAHAARVMAEALGSSPDPAATLALFVRGLSAERSAALRGVVQTAPGAERVSS